MKIAFLAALLLGIGSAAGAQEAPPAREASAPLTLRKCLEIGLEQNYDVRIVRNEERVSDNNATAGNAGMLPTVDLSAGYTGTLDNDRTVTPRNGDATTETGVYDQTANVGLAVNWTLFDGLRIRTNYKRLKEMQQMGALKTRITIEDFMASLTAEYYNYIQQTLRLENFRYAVSLSRERLRITEARVQVGNFSRLDLLQARVDFNADSSKYMSQHELVTASRIRINELLANENLDERFSIPDSVIRVNATLDWNDLLAKTLSANASLLMAEHNSSLAELDLKTVLARNYPYVNLTTGYGYTYNRYGTGGNLSRGTLGLEQNYDVRIVRNEERVSDNNATAGNAGMLPTVDLSAGYTGTLDNDRTVTPRNGDATTETGVYDQTANVGLAVNWTLFDGLRIRTNYKRLKEMQQMGALKTRITIEDFMASLTAEYYNYIQQTLRLENFRYAVSLSRERLRITEARVQVGNFSRLDLLQARVDFNADSSKYMSQHELVTASRIRINELLANENLDERFSIPDSVIRVNATLDWNDLLAKTLSANASLLMAEHNSSLAELDLKTVLARNYPYVNLTTGYGYTYNRYGTGGNLSRGTLGLNAGVKVGFTIFDGNRRREQRNARIGVENAQLTQQRLEQSLRADLSNFWQAYRNNLEVILLEEENLIAAKENYEIAMERYLLGDLPGIEMREAQKSLLDAEERILTAQYNTKLCEISLQQISGNVMVYLE